MKNYIANFETNETLDQVKFKANNLKEAKKYAQAYKRQNFCGAKMRTTTKEYKKIF